MISKLRIRMTILVCSVLILVSAGIVLSVNYMNWRNITSQAEEALETLSENRGVSPRQLRENQRRDGEPPAKPEGEEDPPDKPQERDGMSEKPDEDREPPGEGSSRSMRGQPMDFGDALADLGNYYVITLTDDGEVASWTSDRSDLYSDDQVGEMAQLALASGKTKGRIGTQFFRLAGTGSGKQLIVLDERLEMISAGNVLRTTALIAALSCLLLCIGAWFLIRAMVRPVQEAFDRQKQFVWDASHELKTPLAVIGANAQVLEGEIGENEYLGYIRSEVSRTNEMLSGLLTLARMDQGKIQIHKEETDLGKAVLSAALPFESAAFEQGKTLVLQEPEGIVCHADEALIRQLMVILLSNALKYSDDGGTIAVELAVKGRLREIRVSNTGPGIAPKDLERIFERFYRGDSSHNREVEGYGLGLAIARNIAQAHGGKIRAESVADHLTVFAVTLPA